MSTIVKNAPLMLTMLGYSIVGCSQTEDSTMYIPNAFTPDNDGTNEVWSVVTDEIWDEFRVEVFNQWGQLVWFTEDQHNCKWNGSNTESGNGEYYNSTEVFYYIVRARKGFDFVNRTGHIHLVR